MTAMIFIVVKWKIRPEYSADWLTRVDDFTRSTRAEPGNLFFEWSRSVDDPDVYVLVEAFADSDAGGQHVRSEHFAKAVSWMPDYVASTPQIVSTEIANMDGWGEMGEVQARSA
jgi:quinol monooxygenase YgiN